MVFFQMLLIAPLTRQPIPIQIEETKFNIVFPVGLLDSITLHFATVSIFVVSAATCV